MIHVDLESRRSSPFFTGDQRDPVAHDGSAPAITLPRSGRQSHEYPPQVIAARNDAGYF